DDDQGIFVILETSLKPRRVSRRGLFPSWAPDGIRIAYEDGQTTHVLDTDSGVDRRLTAGGGQPVWSHDGNSIAYVSASGVLWTISALGGTPRTVASMPHLNSAEWSPDDKQLAFHAGDRPARTAGWVVR